jgi:hypothetical protein
MTVSSELVEVELGKREVGGYIHTAISVHTEHWVYFPNMKAAPMSKNTVA